MAYDPVPPFRRDFDAARDPYTARNALGILDTGGGAPGNAEYITGSADATLTNERVLTNTPTVTWDFSTAGQAKATATVDLSAYAPLASPTFTGDPKAPTPAAADNDTSIATTAFVTGALATLYSTGTWTPTLTFVTPGDLAITYSGRLGTYTKIGNLVVVHFSISTSAFTWTTASGTMSITGLPFAVVAGATMPACVGGIDFGGITKAVGTYTHFQLEAIGGTSELRIIANSSGATRAFIAAVDMPSGGSIVLRGSVAYQT